jgi:hypothetical protein
MSGSAKYALFTLLLTVLCVSVASTSTHARRSLLRDLIEEIQSESDIAENVSSGSETNGKLVPTSSLRWESSASAGFTQTFNMLIYGPDNVTVSQATGFGLDYCITEGQSAGQPNSIYVTVSSATATTTTLSTSYYTGVGDCSGVPVVRERVFNAESPYTITYSGCGPNDDDSVTVTFPTRQTTYLASSPTPYNALPPGSLYQSYYNDPNCNTPYLEYSWTAMAVCGDPNTEGGYCYSETVLATGPYSATMKSFQDSCATLEYTSEATLAVHCHMQNSSESYSFLYNKASNNDDDYISLSQAEYGVLIASVFIALFVGIIATGLVLVYVCGAKFTSEPMANAAEKI